MKKLLLIPTAIFPYLICLCLGYGFFSGNFNNPTISVLAIFCLVCGVLAPVGNIVFMILSRKISAESLIKTALVLKTLHILPYILIFILGVLMGTMFFMTLPFIIFLVLIDYITLFFSDMISVFALIKNAKNNTILSVFAIVCQFVFCADIISLFVLHIISKKTKPTVA